MKSIALYAAVLAGALIYISWISGVWTECRNTNTTAYCLKFISR